MTRDSSDAPDAIEIFSIALEMSPESRTHFLSRTCGSHSSLREEVESLLRAHGEGGADFLSEPIRIESSLEMLGQLFAGATIGTQLGSYRLVRPLATGGMGAVYLAERTDEAYQKQVAIKLIHPGLWGSEAVDRFRRERQVLADLEHPAIARLIDGGSTEGEQPYLVMEYIDGLPIDRWCDEQMLDVAARLDLFLEVCEAVLYAHQNLVIHRDLKPGNIFVDRSGRVKLLDFGIAKVLSESDATEGDDRTRSPVPFTQRYASPEQVDGTRITTATDIYSLGVLLYELLTGGSPYDLHGKSSTQIAHIITHEAPIPPSRRAAAAEARRLSGDLDMIVLKALKKEPARRYLTAEEFAADIRRHLSGLPVLARPDTAAYRFSKFVARNKALIFASAAVLIIIMAALVATIGAYREARRAQRDAEWNAYEASLAAAESALRAAQIAEAADHLEAAPAKLRSWEWHHFNTRLDRSVESFRAHDQGITRVLSLPSGNDVLTCSIDGTVKRWKGVRGELVRTYGPFGAEVESVVALLGSDIVAIGLNDGRVLLVNLDSGSTRELLPSGAPWAFVTANADGSRLACGDFDGHVRVWDVSAGTLVANWKAHEGLALPAYSPDGRVLAVGGGNGGVNIYDARSHARRFSLDAHSRRVYSMTFTLDGAFLVTGSMDQTAKVWNVRSGELVRTFREHRATVGAILVDPDGNHVLTAAGDGRLLRWSLSAGEVQGEFRGHRADVTALASSPDGAHVLSADWGGVVKSWEWTTDDVRTFRITTGWLVPQVFDAAWDPKEQQVACASTDVVVQTWNRTGTATRRFRSGQPCRGVVYSSDGETLYAGNDGGEIMLFGQEHDPRRVEKLHRGPILAVAADPGGKVLATASADSSVKLLRLPEIDLLHEFAGNETVVQDLAFSPNGEALACAGADGTIRLWSVATGRCIAAAHADDDPVNGVAFDATGRRLVSVSGSGAVRIWDDELNPIHSLSVSGSQLQSVAWSADGARIATGASDAVVRLYDEPTGRQVTSLHGHVAAITSLHFSRNDAFLTSTSLDGTVRVWDFGRALPVTPPSR